MFKPNIEKLKEKKNVKGLIKALKYKDPEVREKAAKALGQLGDTRAVGPLIKALSDWDEYEIIKVLVAKSLGQIGDAQAVEPLIKILEHKSKDVRKAAIEALGQIGDERAIDPLIESFNDEYVSWNIIADALTQIGEPVFLPLIKTMEDYRFPMRAGAALALGRLGDTRAVGPLTKVLRDSVWSVWAHAASALWILNWRPGQDEIGALYWIAKKNIAKCSLLGPFAIEPLIKTLDFDERHVREFAGKALARVAEKNPELLISRWDEIKAKVDIKHIDVMEYRSSDCDRHTDEAGFSFPDKPKDLDF